MFIIIEVCVAFVVALGIFCAGYRCGNKKGYLDGYWDAHGN